MQTLVLDTNIALDLLVFADPAVDGLRDDIAGGRCRWLCTAAMRAELARVLDYPLIAARLARQAMDAAQVLGAFDALVSPVDAPATAPVACRDPDDQKFVDLAVAHGAVLLSKDAEVLRLARRLAAHGVVTSPTLPRTGPPGPSASTA